MKEWYERRESDKVRINRKLNNNKWRRIKIKLYKRLMRR